MKKRNLVYSTDQGRLCSECENPVSDCQCKNEMTVGDGNVRIVLETKGRKGKGVTTITGVPLADAELKVLAKKLKKICGTGGALKESVIEIQGDHREKLKTVLEKEGFSVKLAGG